MSLLVLGLFLWTVIHFVPSLGLPLKVKWLGFMGDQYYKLSFTVIIVISLVLMIMGWRQTAPSYLYALPAYTQTIALALMVLAIVFFGAARQPTRIKQYVRHPQLLGVIVWSVAHLMVNGDTRSLLLFGWLGCWAFFEIFLINKREGEWIKVEVPNWAIEIRTLVVSLVVFIAIVFAHPYLSGISIL